MSSDVRMCAVMPSYNHARVAGTIVSALVAEGLPVFVIDDGSDEPARSALAALNDPASQVRVHRLAENRGKGGAVCQGFRLALDGGFTHALQVDADGSANGSAFTPIAVLNEVTGTTLSQVDFWLS